jgi:hypothetical protein
MQLETLLQAAQANAPCMMTRQTTRPTRYWRWQPPLFPVLRRNLKTPKLLLRRSFQQLPPQQLLARDVAEVQALLLKTLSVTEPAAVFLATRHLQPGQIVALVVTPPLVCEGHSWNAFFLTKTRASLPQSPSRPMRQQGPPRRSMTHRRTGRH